MILSKSPEIGKKINSALFPGIQGGPLEHVIAGKAQALYENLQPSFNDYIHQVVKNATAMADEFNHSENIRVVSGGTDNHLIVLDITDTGLTGKESQSLLDEVKITTNKEAIPNDQRSPFITSGLRLGTPAITSRGFDETDTRKVADLIAQMLNHPKDDDVRQTVIAAVQKLVNKHPIQ